jgi:hypothetical protein
MLLQAKVRKATTSDRKISGQGTKRAGKSHGQEDFQIRLGTKVVGGEGA